LKISGKSQDLSAHLREIVLTDRAVATNETPERPIMAGIEISITRTINADTRVTAIRAVSDVTPSHEGLAKINRGCSKAERAVAVSRGGNSFLEGSAGDGVPWGGVDLL
jgi:hypothetical protein